MTKVSDGTETNPYAIAANFMANLSCAIGRGIYLPIGNTWHHTRLFCLHVGRSGRGRKGDALSLVMRLDQAVRGLNETFAPQIHRGGLSSREGLVALMHDGYKQGTFHLKISVVWGSGNLQATSRWAQFWGDCFGNTRLMTGRYDLALEFKAVTAMAATGRWHLNF